MFIKYVVDVARDCCRHSFFACTDLLRTEQHSFISVLNLDLFSGDYYVQTKNRMRCPLGQCVAFYMHFSRCGFNSGGVATRVCVCVFMSELIPQIVGLLCLIKSVNDAYL